MLLLLLALVASPREAKTIDLSAFEHPFQVFTDGKSRFVIASVSPESYWVDLAFYGDGKTFYDATVRGYTLNTDDPRYPHGASVLTYQAEPNKVVVQCGERKTVLDALPDAERDALLAKAVVHRAMLEFIPYTLARDDKGTYYYVDKGRYSDNADVFRVFAGPRGGMKPLKLANVVHDSAGDIFATAKGDLRLITGNPNRTEWWKGGQHSELTNVPVEANLMMIFNQLGPYKNTRLGTPCDDL